MCGLRCGYFLVCFGSLLCRLLCFVFLIFAVITFNFPAFAPVDAQNMNYCSAAIGVIGLVSLVTWVVDGRKNFTGPDTGVENLVAVEKRGVWEGAGVGVGGGVPG